MHSLFKTMHARHTFENTPIPLACQLASHVPSHFNTNTVEMKKLLTSQPPLLVAPCLLRPAKAALYPLFALYSSSLHQLAMFFSLAPHIWRRGSPISLKKGAHQTFNGVRRGVTSLKPKNKYSHANPKQGGWRKKRIAFKGVSKKIRGEEKIQKEEET